APLAPFAAAPAGLPSSGSTVPPQAEAQGFEVPPGMRLEPVTRMQSVEPVTQEVRQAEPVSREVGGEEPSLSPEARWDEKDSTLIPEDRPEGQLQVEPTATRKALDAMCGLAQAAAKSQASTVRKESRDKAKDRIRGRQKEAEQQWMSRQKPKLGDWSLLRQSAMPRGAQERASSAPQQSAVTRQRPLRATFVPRDAEGRQIQFHPPARAEPRRMKESGNQTCKCGSHTLCICNYASRNNSCRKIYHGAARPEGRCVVHSGAFKRSGSAPRPARDGMTPI
ncbi:unnamed protein product, partial [Symbiodinium pilosum]